jgi:hemerythrin
MDIKVPQALIEDHKNISLELDKASKMGGKVGEAAIQLKNVWEAHFKHEEEFALPPLGLLPGLASGELDLSMDEAIVMTDTLKTEMPQMIDEHKAILAAIDKFTDAARQEGKLGYGDFIQDMKLHIREEEQVYYPAAILVGAFLRVKHAMVFDIRFP